MQAYAKPEFLEVAKQTYRFKSGGKLDTISCRLCHDSGGPPKLNPYGNSVQKAIDSTGAKKLTSDNLRSIEKEDADGDGFSNGEELKLDTLPGDAASKPPGVPSRKVGGSEATVSDARNQIQKILLPKHAQHPVLVHFPIALFIIGFLFDIVGYGKKRSGLISAGYLNLAVAAIAAPFAVTTGLIAWQTAYGGAPLKGELLIHLIMGSSSALLIASLWKWRASHKGLLPVSKERAYLVISGLVAFLLGATGHFGGILVGYGG